MNYGTWQFASGADYEMGVGWKKTWLRLFHDGFAGLNVSSDQRFVLARSGWTGTQRYGHAIWSGDIGSDFHPYITSCLQGKAWGWQGTRCGRRTRAGTAGAEMRRTPCLKS